MSGILGALFCVLFLAASWLVAGWALVRRIQVRLLPGERLALALLAGAGLTGVLLFVAGLAWFSPSMILIVAGLGFVPTFASEERRTLWATIRAVQLPNASVTLPVCAVIGVLCLAGLARRVGPMGNDAISYHLYGPALWLRSGRVVTALDMSTTAFPVAIEALFGASMALGGERAPGVAGVLLGSCLLVQVFGLARWAGASDRWAGMASVLVAFMPAALGSAPAPFVDAEYAAFALAAFRVLFAGDAEEFAAGGMFLGLAAATKYNGILLIPVTFALAGLRHTGRLGFRNVGKKMALPMAISVALMVPVLIRNWVVLGSPIYPPPPALARLISRAGGGVKAFPLSASISLQQYILERGQGLGRGFFDFLLLPWRFTYHTSNFHGAGGIGVAPLAFFPAALIGRRTAAIGWAAVWIGVNAAIWFITQQEARFLISVVVLATAVAAVGGQELVRRFPRLGRVAVASAVVCSVAYGVVLTFSYKAAVASVFSRAANQRRWTDEVPFSGGIEYLNRLPEPCKVLILSWSVPPYYLHKDFVKIEGLYYERPIPSISDPAEALRRLPDLAVTHLLDVVPPTPRGPRFAVPVPPPPGLALVFDSPTARVFRVTGR